MKKMKLQSIIFVCNQLVLCVTIVPGFGVSLSVIANVIMNSNKAFVKTIAIFKVKNSVTLKSDLTFAALLFRLRFHSFF